MRHKLMKLSNSFVKKEGKDEDLREDDVLSESSSEDDVTSSAKGNMFSLLGNEDEM